jgi:hypothetical protein
LGVGVASEFWGTSTVEEIGRLPIGGRSLTRCAKFGRSPVMINVLKLFELVFESGSCTAHGEAP